MTFTAFPYPSELEKTPPRRGKGGKVGWKKIPRRGKRSKGKSLPELEGKELTASSVQSRKEGIYSS